MSFNESDIYVDPEDLSKLYVQHRLDVTVQDSDGNPINDVSITGSDTNSVDNIDNPTSNFLENTNSSGYIIEQILSEFMINGTYNTTANGYLYFNNYTITASKSGYTSATEQLYLASNQLLVITLTGTGEPTPTPVAASVAIIFVVVTISIIIFAVYKVRKIIAGKVL